MHFYKITLCAVNTDYCVCALVGYDEFWSIYSAIMTKNKYILICLNENIRSQEWQMGIRHPTSLLELRNNSPIPF